jgi:hypothetical protein
MKFKFLILSFILSCGFLKAQVKLENIKGTWAIAAMCSQDTNIIVMYRRDSVFSEMLSNKYPDKVFMYRSNSGKFTDYWFYNLQYFSFDKKMLGCGYAKDSTYARRERGYQGKYSISGSNLYSPFFVFRQWQSVTMFDAPMEYKISLDRGFLVMVTKGGSIIYYRKISEEVLFRD